MMKFFALVALALVATSDASTVAAVTATRSTSLVAGAAGGNLVLSVTASNAGAIAASGTITAVVDGNIFSADGDTACTATAEDASGTAVTTAPTFVSTLTGTAANKGVVTNQGTGTETITFTMGAANTDILADDHKIIITCTGNLATNAATATTYTFSATEPIFTAGGNSAATTCTTAVATGTAPTSTTTSATSTSVLVVTFVGQALATNVEATITCTANLADNGATAQAVTFGLVTSADLTFTFTPTTAIAATGTATITASEALYTAADATTTTVASSGTGVTGNNVLVLTFVGHGVNAGSV